MTFKHFNALKRVQIPYFDRTMTRTANKMCRVDQLQIANARRVMLKRLNTTARVQIPNFDLAFAITADKLIVVGQLERINIRLVASESTNPILS